MNYSQGIEYMKKLAVELKEYGGGAAAFRVGELIITYPGYKQNGDYKLRIGKELVPRHTDMVKEIYQLTTKENFDQLSFFLEDVYLHGLDAQHNLFDKAFKEKLYWITLQEEINYPQPKRAGRSLSFMRYYEGALAKIGIIELEKVILRTAHRGQGRPPLINLKGIRRPRFYVEYYTGTTKRSYTT